MKRIPLIATLVMLPPTLVACAADEPRTEIIRAEADLALWPLSTTSDEARQYFADGFREWDMERDVEAYEHFQRAIAADPALALAELGASGTAQEFSISRAHLARAVELAPQAGEVERILIAIVQSAVNGDNERALELGKQLVEADSTNARSWLTLAERYEAVGQREEARSAARRATEIQPRFAPARIFLAFSYSQLQPRDLALAEEHARRAVEAEPDEPATHDYLGDALRAQGRLEEAADEYTRAAELDPTKGAALQQRGHVNTFLGRYAEARADYDAAVELATGNAKAGLGMYRALVHIYEGDPRGAVEELEEQYQAIDGMDIPDPTALKAVIAVNQRTIAQHAGLLADARRAVKRLAELNRDAAERVGTEDVRRWAESMTAFDAGYLAVYEGDYETAREKAREFMRIRAPERNPNANRPAHFLLGMAAFFQDRPAEAVEQFEQASPDNGFATYHKALALEQLGRTDDAREAFRTVAETYFNNAEIAVTRQSAIEKLKQLDG